MTGQRVWIATVLGLVGATLGCGGGSTAGGGRGAPGADSAGTTDSAQGAGSGGSDAFDNASGAGTGGAVTVPAAEPPKPNPEAFWAEDPPPMMCLEDGSMGPPPVPPGGTPECPDDKNREGCACTHVGEQVACWPGLRANRNRGICRDGKAECLEFGEFAGSWGPCKGYVLPLDGATEGPDACQCFSQGRWVIDNLSPCFVSYTGSSGAEEIWAVSTFIGPGGMSGCPTDPAGPPPLPEPGSDWSTSRLTVDCAGHFELCYTLKAGDVENPQPSDCTLSRSCVETWYAEAGVTQELPPLGAWSTQESTCAAEFQRVGGYGEMTVKGLSAECDAVDDGHGNELVFNRVPYCPATCATSPDLPECQSCSMGGSGDF